MQNGLELELSHYIVIRNWPWWSVTKDEKDPNLISNNLHHHFPEQISRTTGPPVLLEPESFESTGKFTFHLQIKLAINKNKIINQDELF